MRDPRRAWPALLIAACSHIAVAPESRADDRDIGTRLRACAACHGEQGRGSAASPAPSIAGEPDAYLYEQLRSFRDQKREHGRAQQMLAFLSDDYLREIAAYYAAQTPADPRDMLVAADRKTAP